MTDENDDNLSEFDDDATQNVVDDALGEDERAFLDALKQENGKLPIELTRAYPNVDDAKQIVSSRPTVEMREIIDEKGDIQHEIGERPPGFASHENWGQGRRALSRELWERIKRFYDENPGDINGCMVKIGIGRTLAKRAWAGPAWAQYPWAIPLQLAFAAEEREVLKRRAEARDEAEKKYTEEREKLKAAKAELQRMDDGILRVGRVVVVRGLAHAVKITEGLEFLAVRIADQLKRGIDEDGNKIRIKPKEGIQLMREFTRCLNDLMSTGELAIKLSRLKDEQPTEIVGVSLPAIPLHELEAEVRGAHDAINRAKAKGLYMVRGGKHAVGDDGNPPLEEHAETQEYTGNGEDEEPSP